MIVAITDRRFGTGDAHIGPAATPAQTDPGAGYRQRSRPRPSTTINVREGYPRDPDHSAAASRPSSSARLWCGARRRASFHKSTIDLLETFADQSVVAIQNANLFHEIEEKAKQLAVASQHKSQFLAT